MPAAREIPVPAGASRWRRIVGTQLVTIAEADDGELYQSGSMFMYVDAGVKMRLMLRPDGVTGWKSLAGGGTVAAAIGDDGEIYTWRLGNSPAGYLGSSTKAARPAGVDRWVDVACGDLHFLAIGSNGRAYSWGDNEAGQLGIGVAPYQPEPVLIASLPSTTGINLAGFQLLPWLLPDGRFQLYFNTDPGGEYRIDYASEPGAWQQAATPLAGTGGTLTWTDSGPDETASPPGQETVRWYRVRAVP
jgi:hypothetical protein